MGTQKLLLFAQELCPLFRKKRCHVPELMSNTQAERAKKVAAGWVSVLGTSTHNSACSPKPAGGTQNDTHVFTEW